MELDPHLKALLKITFSMVLGGSTGFLTHMPVAGLSSLFVIPGEIIKILLVE